MGVFYRDDVIYIATNIIVTGPVQSNRWPMRGRLIAADIFLLSLLFRINSMDLKLRVAAISIMAVYGATAGGAQPTPIDQQAIGVCLIPEFGYIPELRSWRKYEEGAISPKEVLHFEQAWEMSWRKKVATVITPDVVREMVMQRDRHGMAEYTRSPSFENIKWRPATLHPTKEKSYVVFEGTADTLPRITAIRRWLMVYCLYDVKQGTVSRVTITIRGERDE